jgi:hypothetical protein
MHYSIEQDKNGKPYLKKDFTKRMTSEKLRGQWIEVGPDSWIGTQKLVELNRQNGLIVLLDEDGFWRALVLVD